MANLNYSEYHCFATFTVASTTYYVGTVTEYRGGQWYDAVIQAAPEPSASFGDDLGIKSADDVSLVLVDTPTGTYRTLVNSNVMEGVAVSLTLVTRQNWSDGTVTELLYQQALTINGTELAPGLVTLKLTDLEDAKLATLWPPNTWQPADWPDLRSDDAGKPVGEPVGTAIKFNAPLIRSDQVNSLFWYGICTGTPKLYAITAINAGAKTVTVSANVSGLVDVGQVILLNGTSATDGRYTVTAVTPGTSSVITVLETLTAATGGNVRAMPNLLTLYRNGRIVTATEYTQQHLYAPCTIVNGNFAAGFTNWTQQFVGTGASSSAGVGGLVMTSLNASNYAQTKKLFSTDGGAPIAGAYYAIQVTVAAGGADAMVVIAGNANQRCIAGQTTTVLAVTVNQIVLLRVYNDTGTTTITNVSILPYNLLMLSFAIQQTDFNGSAYTFAADVRGVESRNAVTEVQRLLGLAGVSTDATTFGTAATYAASNNMLIDCDYGRDQQRAISAILGDLLFVCRAGLSRSAAGAYTIWQDDPGTAVATLDESLGDTLQMDTLTSASRPISVGLSYYPSSSDPNGYQQTITRTVSGGLLGAEQPRQIRYIRDHVTADRLLCYLALRRQFNKIGSGTIYRQQFNLGDVVNITSPMSWAGARNFTVWGVQRVKQGNLATLREYDPSVYTYTAAAALPPTAGSGYAPDYSETPPAAPTALAITSNTAVAIANDGTSIAHVGVKAIPPSVNWTTLYIAAQHNVTGELAIVPCASVGGGYYGAVIPGLRPGEVYQLYSYAVNVNNVQGVAVNTFDATAIGGGAAVTTFTTPGVTVLPPNVASITATQSNAKSITVAWPAVSTKNLQQYVLKRNSTVIYSGLATSYVDTFSLVYGSAYTYTVVAQDTYGNLSATPASIVSSALAGIISGGSGNDITSGTVATVNRTNTTTLSASYTLPLFPGGAINYGFTLTHGLGRNPICGACCSGGGNAVAYASVVTTTTLTLNAMSVITSPGYAPAAADVSTSSTTVTAVGTAHSHFITVYAGSATASIDVW